MGSRPGLVRIGGALYCMVMKILSNLLKPVGNCNLQNGWQLEQCTKPVDAESNNSQPPPKEILTNSHDSSDTSTLTSTDTTIPNHSEFQTSAILVTSPVQNQSSCSHTFFRHHSCIPLPSPFRLGNSPSLAHNVKTDHFSILYFNARSICLR